MRRHERVPLSTAVVMTWEDGGGAVKYVRGRSLDLSASGMRVEVAESIPQRTYVTVKAQKVALTVTASVRHCFPTRGKYLIGLEFSCPMKNLAERLAREAEAASAPVPEGAAAP
jgi:hypothetical protein